MRRTTVKATGHDS